MVLEKSCDEILNLKVDNLAYAFTFYQEKMHYNVPWQI